MLRAVSEEVAHCYERARRAEQPAENEHNSAERIFYLDEEKRWLALAESYEHQERLEVFLRELKHRLSRRTGSLH
jgi:hypothetical protein